MTPQEMEQRIVRYGELQPCRTAFIDAHTPGSDQKENFTIIGAGVTESPHQHVHIRETPGFNIGAAGQPPKCRNSLHFHTTAEVFFVLRGRWRFFWGRRGTDGEFIAEEGDIFNIPTGIFRGFENVGTDYGMIMSILGGDDAGGGVTWAPQVIEEAKDHGLVLGENGVVYDTKAGEALPHNVGPMVPLSEEQCAAIPVVPVEGVVRDYVARYWDLMALAAGKPAKVIGPDALLKDRPGFEVDFLTRGSIGPEMYATDRHEIIMPVRGHWMLAWEGGSTVLNPGDTAAVPPGMKRALAPTMTGEASLYRIRNTDDPAGATWTGWKGPDMAKICTTHVGSLPRSQEVVDFIFARERGEAYDPDAFDTCMTAAVSQTVHRQAEAGIDIVSDGETSKISYATYVKDRYTGFDGDSPRNAPADLKMFPGFLKRIADEGGTPQYARPMCVGEVRSKGQGELEKDIANLKAAMAAHGVERGFMNAASPGVISLFLQNDHYPTREAYLAALADAMKAEYETIVAAGLDLQLDCPDLALSRHMLFTELSDEEFVKVANLHVEALNHALRDVPRDRVRVHICWGNYEGPHCCDIPMDKVFTTLMNTKSRYVLFETSNPRHAHEWTVFRDRRTEIPDDKVLVPGVIDSTTNFVEHPEVVAQRIERFVDIVGAERVIAGSDCGFGTFAGFGAVDPDIAYAKLKSLAEGAALLG